jgi:hypothetical protein
MVQSRWNRWVARYPRPGALPLVCRWPSSLRRPCCQPPTNLTSSCVPPPNSIEEVNGYVCPKFVGLTTTNRLIVALDKNDYTVMDALFL